MGWSKRDKGKNPFPLSKIIVGRCGQFAIHTAHDGNRVTESQIVNRPNGTVWASRHPARVTSDF